MASLEVKHDALIKLIPCRINLSTVAHQQPSTTCEYCAMIVPDRRKVQNGLIKTGYERVDLYPEFSGLKASAKAGCDLCRLIRKTIRKTWAVRPMEEWGVGPVRQKDGLWDELLDAPWDQKVKIYKVTFNLETMTEKIDDGMVISLGLEFGPATRFVCSDLDFQYGEIGQALSFKVFDSQGKIYSNRLSQNRRLTNVEDLHERYGESRRRLPSTSTLSARNLKMIAKWIDECKSSHSSCLLGEDHWHPTRLLDVGTQDGQELPRLIETAEEFVEGPYAALSHMWGDPNQGHAPPLRTLKANYEEMKSGIPRQMASKNFVDAIITTRRFGLQYIWIDSLCIIQDSEDDWNQEAGTMHMVYENAEITIVATSAISANDGFLERHLTTIPAVKVGYSLDTTTDAAESILLSDENTSQTGNWSSDVEGSLWNKRGWTLQERSVSTRMLHFCKNKVYFECRGCLKSEENEPLERYQPRTFEMWPRREDQKANNLPLRKADAETYRLDIHKRWTRALTEYSQRRLTKGTDKLRAIQAIAIEMSLSVSDTYIACAGMWMDQLQRDLLWQVRDGPASAPQNPRAPTWSWASLDAGLHWEAGAVNINSSNQSLSKSLFRVLNVASDSFGHDLLTVEAFMKPIAFILPCDNDDRWINGSRTKLPYDVFIPNASSLFDETLESLVSALSLAERSLAAEAGNFIQVAEARLDMDDRDDLTKSHQSLSYLHVNRARPSGLILEATESLGVWKRVGVASVFRCRTGDLFVDPLFAESEHTQVNIL